MRGPALLSVTLLVATALAGCAGNEEASEPAAVAESIVEAQLGGSILAGVVITSEIQPIAGAVLSLDQAFMATSDAEGRFEFRGLEPGSHKLYAQALGYSSVARSVDLNLDAVADIQVILEPLPIQEPYVELVILRGYSICDISLVVWITIISPCPIGTPVRNVRIKMAESWQYGIVEMSWRALESFILYTSLDGNCNTNNQCFGAVAGRSPLRLEMAPADDEIAKKYAPFTSVVRPYPEGKFTLQSNVLYAGALQDELDGVAHDQCVVAIGFRFGCPGVGVSAAGIAFTKHVSVFHWERPADPAAYSAMPDA